MLQNKKINGEFHPLLGEILCIYWIQWCLMNLRIFGVVVAEEMGDLSFISFFEIKLSVVLPVISPEKRYKDFQRIQMGDWRKNTNEREMNFSIITTLFLLLQVIMHAIRMTIWSLMMIQLLLYIPSFVKRGGILFLRYRFLFQSSNGQNFNFLIHEYGTRRNFKPGLVHWHKKVNGPSRSC